MAVFWCIWCGRNKARSRKRVDNHHQTVYSVNTSSQIYPPLHTNNNNLVDPLHINNNDNLVDVSSQFVPVPFLNTKPNTFNRTSSLFSLSLKSKEKPLPLKKIFSSIEDPSSISPLVLSKKNPITLFSSPTQQEDTKFDKKKTKKNYFLDKVLKSENLQKGTSENNKTMPRIQSPRRSQSLLVGVGGFRPPSPDLMLVPVGMGPSGLAPPSSKGANSSSGACPEVIVGARERPIHTVMPRPISISTDAHAAAYLYSCHAPYARYLILVPCLYFSYCNEV